MACIQVSDFNPILNYKAMSDDSSTGSSDTDKLEEGGSSSLPECIQESDLEAISVSISQKGISIDELGQKLKIQAEDIEKVKDESEIRGQVLKLLHVWKNQGDTSSVTLDHLVNATGIKLQEVQSHLSARPDLEVCRKLMKSMQYYNHVSTST